MATGLRIGIVGRGHAAGIHLGRLAAIEGVKIVGCADTDLEAAKALATTVETLAGAIPAFADHREMLRQAEPEAIAIFTPHLAHYRPAMDALQAGCHVFVEKPLAISAQEATDIVNLARARDRKVAVGHQFRLLPSLIEARRRIHGGELGPIRLVSAIFASPWLAAHQGPEDSWRLDPRASGGGIVADAGEHLLDALLWITGKPAVDVAAFQARLESGLDVVDSAALRLAGGVPATLAISGVSPGSLFEINIFGENGRLKASEDGLWISQGTASAASIPLPETKESIDGNFIASLMGGTPLCCPAAEALETVRLLEAIARSASTGQVVHLA